MPTPRDTFTDSVPCPQVPSCCHPVDAGPQLSPATRAPNAMPSAVPRPRCPPPSATSAHLQHLVDGFAVHGLLVVGGLVEGAGEGAEGQELLHADLREGTWWPSPNRDTPRLVCTEQGCHSPLRTCRPRTTSPSGCPRLPGCVPSSTRTRCAPATRRSHAACPTPARRCRSPDRPEDMEDTRKGQL